MISLNEIIYEILCLFGIVVGTILCIIAPEEVKQANRITRTVERILIVLITVLLANVYVKSLTLRIIVYAVLILVIVLETRLLNKILLLIVPIVLAFLINKNSVHNIILVFILLLVVGIAESYITLKKVFDKRKKTLSIKHTKLILKNSLIEYTIMLLLTTITLILM